MEKETDIFTQWRRRVGTGAASGESSTHSLGSISRAGRAGGSFWKSHRAGVGAPHCTRPAVTQHNMIMILQHNQTSYCTLAVVLQIFNIQFQFPNFNAGLLRALTIT